jgi:hypothetical protein
MHDLSARAVAVEAAYHEQAAGLVRLGNELSALNRRFDGLSHIVRGYDPNQQQPHHPNMPYDLPRRLLRNQDPGGWETFLREWKADHR